MTVVVGFGWFGFGACGGSLPEVRLGVLRLACCRGWIGDQVLRWRAALAEARAALAEMGRVR